LTHFIKMFDLATWFLIFLSYFCIVLSAPWLLEKKRCTFEAWLVAFVPLVEVSHTESWLANKPESGKARQLLVLWTLCCLVLSNCFKSILSSDIVLPVDDKPLRFWNQLVNETHFEILSMLGSLKLLVLERSFRYHGSNFLHRSNARSPFEEEFCSRMPVLNTSNSISTPFCSSIKEKNVVWEPQNFSSLDFANLLAFNRMEIIGKKMIQHKFSNDEGLYYTLRGMNNFTLANERISPCDGQALVDTSEKIEIYLNNIFPKRSPTKNLRYLKSLDEFVGKKLILQYENKISVHVDTLVRIAFENGLYNFWAQLYARAKMQRGMSLSFKEQFTPQTLNSTLATVLIVTSFLFGCALFAFGIERIVIFYRVFVGVWKHRRALKHNFNFNDRIIKIRLVSSKGLMYTLFEKQPQQ